MTDQTVAELTVNDRAVPAVSVDQLVEAAAVEVERLTEARSLLRRERDLLNAQIKAVNAQIDRAGRVARSLEPRRRRTVK